MPNVNLHGILILNVNTETDVKIHAETEYIEEDQQEQDNGLPKSITLEVQIICTKYRHLFYMWQFFQ